MAWALVTGASTGIGLEIAHELARRGWNIAGAARGEQRLGLALAAVAAAHGVETHAVTVDLGAPDGPATLVRELDASGIDPAFVANNAGFGGYGPFIAQDRDRLELMLSLNMRALTLLCREYAERMSRAGSGHILNVASTAGMQAGPWQAAYHATKAYVISLSEALAVELRPAGVAVTCVCPGYTRTEFMDNASIGATPRFSSLVLADAESVGRYAVRAALGRKVVAVPGFPNKVMAVLSRLAPRALVRAVTGRLLDYEGTARSSRTSA